MPHAICCALKRCIVHQDGNAILRQFYVVFGHFVAKFDSSPHGAEGVLGRERTAASVGDKKRVIPWFLGGHSKTRLDKG